MQRLIEAMRGGSAAFDPLARPTQTGMAIAKSAHRIHSRFGAEDGMKRA